MNNKKKWIVFTSAVIISLALGILYTWSILKSAIEKSIDLGCPGSFQWDKASLNDPYSAAVLVFAFVMIISGKVFDKFGPRITALTGGVLVTAGLFLASSSESYFTWIVGYGILVGAGIGFGYAVITPVVLKWFPPEKTGLIAGIIVAGIGVSSVYMAPLFSLLIQNNGISYALSFYAVIFAVVVGVFSFMLFNPPKSPENTTDINTTKNNENDIKLTQLLRKPEFYILWITYFIGAGAGLMVISFVTEMVKKGLEEQAFLGVSILAIGNSGGRILGGYLSDKIGRIRTLLCMFSFQAFLMILCGIFIEKGMDTFTLLAAATLIGVNYGSNLSLYPSIAKDLWGLKNFGTNYGLLFTAWGLGGFILSRVSQMIKSVTGSLEYSFLLGGALLIAGIFALILLKKYLGQNKTN
ncbi:MAG: OFA family MFS transporter [Ignavibacteria bacterium]|nr:OFA family MFS transporter [Ignavibacteria bacterium]